MYDKLVRLLGRLSAGLGTPYAAQVYDLAARGEWVKLQQLRCVPSDYSEPETFWFDHVITELLRKTRLDLGNDTEKVAIETFYECERSCCASNARLTRFLPENGGFGLSSSEWRINDFFIEWRKELGTLMGPLPTHLVPRFSNGATISNKALEASVPDKMSGFPTCYSESLDLLPFFWETSWGKVCRDENRSPKIARGNHFFTVFKDSEKDRGCGKEASVNVALQLAAGSHLRGQLKRVLGLDLRHLQLTHRELARLGSLFGDLATVDMSNASDTVSKVLVKLGAPASWFTLLDSLRAHFTKVKSRWVYLEKFSSMGNGFTFELETCIFLTLARTVVRLEGGDPDRCSCYGDDLIVPTEYLRAVLSVLRFCGFTPNKKKTFGEGPFRESCGGDYFRGVPVRATNLELPPEEPQHWISLANSLRRVCAGIEERWEAILPAWRFCLQQIPVNIRKCRGPVHLGDIVIHDAPEFWSTRYTRSERRLDSPKFRECRTWSPIQERIPLERWGTGVQLAACHLTGKDVSRRSNVQGYKEKWVTCDLTSAWLPGDPWR